MAILSLKTQIAAPVERVFDLARSVELHLQSTAATREVAVGGVREGLVELGDEIEWEARHLGVRQRLLVVVTEFDRPSYFRDEMRRGAFARMTHDHRFERVGSGTEMIDVFEYQAPFGVVGRVVETLFLNRYLQRFLEERNRVLKRIAESEEWRQFV